MKATGRFLPKGYTFQVIHSQKALDNGTLNNAAQAEYKKMNNGKNPCASMYLDAVEVVAL